MRELTTTGLIVTAELFIFCLVILTTIFIYSLKFITREQFRTSKLILLVNLCYGFVIDCDLINAVYNAFPTRIEVFYFIVNTVRYIMYISAALFWFLYCQREFQTKLFTRNVYKFIACLPSIAAVVFILINPLTKLVFYVDSNGVQEGPLFGVVQAVAYIYIILAALFALVRMLRTNDRDEKKRNRAVIIFALPLIVSDILQTVTGYPFLCIGATIALTMVFVYLVIDVHYKNEKKALIRKQRRDSLVGGLTEDYEAVFIVDVEEDSVKSIRLRDKYIEEFSYDEGDDVYSHSIQSIFEKHALDEDRDRLINDFSPVNVWKKLNEDISFAISFRSITSEGKELYYRAKFVKLQDSDAKRFILGLRDDDAQVRAELELEKLREEQAVKERTSKLSTIIEAMTTDYLMLSAMNLDTGDLDIYRESDDYKARMIYNHSRNNYDELKQLFADEFVDDEYYDFILREMEPDNIIDNLRKRRNFYVRFKRKAENRWYEVNMSDYNENTGNVIMGVRNIDELIREERRREQLLRELENARQNDIIAGLTYDFDCVSYIDVNNNMKETFCRTSPIFYNRIPECDKKSGFEKRMVAYADIFVVPEDREKFFEDIATDVLLARLSEKPVYYVNFRINVDDEIRYYQIKFIANTVDGKVQNILAGFHDVDDEMKEELQHQELLKEAKEIAEKGNEAKTMFLFNMSHDIRTPMNAILGFTNKAIKNIEDKDVALDALNKTMDSSGVLLSLINQILDMSRIESGKVELAEDKADMLNFGKNVKPMLEELADDKNIKFEFNINDIADRYVLLDILRIDEIIVNLVSNAIKYTQNGGNVKVDVRQVDANSIDKSQYGNVNDEYAFYELKVADNGYGMSREFLKHLFEDFAREETFATRGIQGTGLGMPLCKKLVDLMNGTIHVESEQNVGSTFTIILPFKIREASIEDEEDEYYDNMDELFEGKKILLAEDNDLNREIAIDILSEDGFIVEEARDGREAVDKVRTMGDDYYDYILMDIRMPYMDGYEATKLIRGFAKKHIPIIALSANAFEEDRAKSIKVGMDDHISKPIEVDKLKRALARFL